EATYLKPWISQLGAGDVLVSNYGYLADMLDMAPAGVRRVIITHDILHKRMLSMGEPRADVMQAREKELLGKAEILVAIQDDEAAVCRQLVPAAQVVTVPLGMTPVAGDSRKIEPKTLLF